MDSWQGDWEFRNFHMRQDGTKGRAEVTASTEQAAREAIKKKASQEVFGDTSWQTYIQVTNLINVTRVQH